MKIGFVLINTGKKGGSEKRLFNIIGSLKKCHQVCLLTNSSVIDFAKELGFRFDGVLVEVLINDKPRPKQNYEANKPQPTSLKLLKSFSSKKSRGFVRELYSILKYNRHVFYWAKRNDLDVVNSLQAAGIYTVALFLTRTRTVFSYMDYAVTNGYPFFWLKNMGLKTVFKFVDKYDFLSSAIPQAIELKGLRLDKKKINIAPNSFVDLNRIKIGEKMPARIAFSGRMEKIKNPLLALEAIYILKQRKVSFEFLMLGAGSLNNEINEFITKYGLSDYVHFYYEPHVEKVLSVSSIYLSLQDGNNYPSQALLEAMASECAIVATDVGETRDLVNQELGYLVKKNAGEIADRVQFLIENPQVTTSMGRKAREFMFRKHTIENYMLYLDKIYCG